MTSPLTLITDTARKIVGSPPLVEADKVPIMQDTSWADGLRGIASLFVVSSHIVLCFARRLVVTCCGSTEGRPYLFQLPILRLIAQGHSFVALFFILSGFVNALKPIKLARSGQTETALSNLAVSSFRRTFRLVLPAATATLMSWMLCQLGMYEYAHNGDAYWLYTYTPTPSSSWGTAIDDLITNLGRTWTLGEVNVYDQPQWALIYLLQGSMMIFCALLITLNLTPRWRVTCLVIFTLWSFDWSFKIRDPLVGFCVFLGIVLAEFSVSDVPEKLAALSPILTPPILVIALVLMSFPTSQTELSTWTNYLNDLGLKIFPPQGELARTWGSLGGILLIFAIIISPHARTLLSRRPLLWLGKISFPVYLLHGTFMRTFMAWFTFVGQRPRSFDVTGSDGKTYPIQRYPQPGVFRLMVAITISMSLMLVAAHWWTKKIEPIFGKITRMAEDVMTGNHGSRTPVLPIRKE